MKPFIIGKEVLALEKIWNQMYRTRVHGRKCQTMIAISSVDNCLWDIIGKYRKEQVFRILGRPVKDKILVYASMLGHSLKPKLVAERAQQIADLIQEYLYLLNIIPLCSGTMFGGGISPFITAVMFSASQIAIASLASSVAEPMWGDNTTF